MRMSAPAAPTRAGRYAAALRDRGAGSIVLTSEAGIRHACGVALFTQRLIPQRPVACVIGADGRLDLVCCVLELDQLRAEHPDLTLHGFAEFGEDPWAIVASLVGVGPVQVEPSIPAPWAEDLAAHLPAGALTVSDSIPAELRAAKDEAELRLFEEGCEATEHAVAVGAASVRPGVSEAEVARGVERDLHDRLGLRATEVAGIVIGPQANRSMHHLPTDAEMPAAGPVRLGAVVRVDGYWLLLTRMLLIGADAGFERDYARYLDVYESTLAELVPGRQVAPVYESCRSRCAAAGFDLETLKIAHSTGLEFREDPCVAPDETATLEPGMILAYDYGLECADGTVLHLEDRVAVTGSGQRRLSGGWDLADLATGFEGLL
jgi:Xaa-Pro aminopeptidase